MAENTTPTLHTSQPTNHPHVFIPFIQFGFTKTYGDGQISHTVFTDSVKAFSRALQVHLLHKLQAYGIAGPLLN